MGREVRKVPYNWNHPKTSDDAYIPLRGGSFKRDAEEWDFGYQNWKEGLRAKYVFDAEAGEGRDEWVPKDDDMGMPYSEWAGCRPDDADYMPDWPDEERTHFQMYEDTSEGTPISPVMETPEELARWLADNGASAFGDMTATYEQWLPICRGGFAPSMVVTGGRIISGVEAMAETESDQ
ncbi:hypothetical protein [Pseudooceanicola atlanticus]|uniref:hypothetical protein n=1 Tax=Pseudooceanicola atlanticus TaxID=1461694 RepID=UPI0023563BD2|nr:hypothetical protein [Pseudooceanicola atlanticus]